MGITEAFDEFGLTKHRFLIHFVSQLSRQETKAMEEAK